MVSVAAHWELAGVAPTRVVGEDTLVGEPKLTDVMSLIDGEFKQNKA